MKGLIGLFDFGLLVSVERKKASMGFSRVDPAIIFLSEDPPGTCTHCSVNFSRIDNPYLEIETEEEGTVPVYIVGLNMQPLRYMSGMVGLVFSK
jgi:hypothetical protein